MLLLLLLLLLRLVLLLLLRWLQSHCVHSGQVTAFRFREGHVARFFVHCGMMSGASQLFCNAQKKELRDNSCTARARGLAVHGVTAANLSDVKQRRSR